MIAASVYMLVFRTIHVLAAVAWGGAVVMLVLFLQPSAKAIGPAAGPFMAELVGRRKLPSAILSLAGTTIVAGGFLYWRDVDVSGGFGDFVGSSFGLWMTVGAASAIVAFLIGLLATKPTMDRVMALGPRIAQAGDPPPADLLGELQVLQARARMLAKVNLAFVTFAAFAMATARYW